MLASLTLLFFNYQVTVAYYRYKAPTTLSMVLLYLQERGTRRELVAKTSLKGEVSGACLGGIGTISA